MTTHESSLDAPFASKFTRQMVHVSGVASSVGPLATAIAFALVSASSHCRVSTAGGGGGGGNPHECGCGPAAVVNPLNKLRGRKEWR